MIPNTVKIGGKNYDVVLRDRLKEDGLDRLGSILFGQQKIVIDSGLVLEAQEQTLIHEIIEGINDCNELNMTHRLISILGEQIYQVLKDNKLEL